MISLNKHSSVLLILLFCKQLFSQKIDTIYFDRNWDKTSKDQALFYRPLPIVKEGNLFLLQDYYMSGKLQFKGRCKDVELQEYEGEVIWYFENGAVSEVSIYKNGKRNGLSKAFLENGQVLCNGIYKDNEPYSGLFFDGRSEFNVLEKGEQKEKLKYYIGAKQLAQKKVFTDKIKSTTTFYDITGKVIGTLTKKKEYTDINGTEVEFYYKNGFVSSVKSISTIKNDGKVGKEFFYDEQGKQLALGIYKEGRHYEGTFVEDLEIATRSDNPISVLIISTYANGNKNGKEWTVCDDKRFLVSGIYKEDKKQNGTFLYYHGSGGNLSLDGEESPVRFSDSYSYESIIVCNYQNGKANGKQTRYNYNTGFLESYYHSVDDKYDGESAQFDEKGQLLYKLFYDDSWPFSGQQKTKKEFISYTNGKLDGEQINYNDTLGIESTANYKDGVILEEANYKYIIEGKTGLKGIYKNGKPYSGYFKSEASTGDNEKIDYYENGIRVAQYSQSLGAKLSQGEYHDNATEWHTLGTKTTFKDGKPYNGVEYLEERNVIVERNITNGKTTVIYFMFFAENFAQIIPLTIAADGYILSTKTLGNNDELEEQTFQVIFLNNEKTKGKVINKGNSTTLSYEFEITELNDFIATNKNTIFKKFILDSAKIIVEEKFNYTSNEWQNQKRSVFDAFNYRSITGYEDARSLTEIMLSEKKTVYGLWDGKGNLIRGVNIKKDIPSNTFILEEYDRESEKVITQTNLSFEKLKELFSN